MRFLNWVLRFVGNIQLVVFTIIFLICIILLIRNFDGFFPNAHVSSGPDVVIESEKMQTHDILKIISGVLAAFFFISILAKRYYHVKYYRLKNYESFDGLNEAMDIRISYFFGWKASFLLPFPFLKKEERKELESTRRAINICFVIYVVSFILMMVIGIYLNNNTSHH